MRIAVVGATGLVGRTIAQVLEERQVPVSQFVPVASARSAGKQVPFKGEQHTVVSLEQLLAQRLPLDFALLSAGGSLSKEYAHAIIEATGATVIDNSSAWRYEADVPLVVPEINGAAIGSSKLIANPNCSTAQLVMVLGPLHQAYSLKRLVISTYQSVTGTGKQAVDQLMRERAGGEVGDVYPHAIDMNCLPQCDVFMDNGYTREEMKLVWECRKILGLPELPVTATAVRVPVQGGHSEAVNLEFERDFDLSELRQLLSNAPGVVVQDDPSQHLYPMPRTAEGHDEVFVGRIRRDESQPRTLNLWVVADNLRKGAATNTVQIAEHLMAVQA